MDAQALYRSLEAGWKGILTGLLEFRGDNHLQGRPFLFTEIGYTHRENSTLQPWAGSGFSLVSTEDDRHLVIWDQQPQRFEERALALRALRAACRELEGEQGERILAGLLYWKLSTEPSHVEIEPFVHILGSDPEDPLGAEMRRFRQTGVLDRWLRSLSFF
jgi:hypothetical protein